MIEIAMSGVQFVLGELESTPEEGRQWAIAFVDPTTNLTVTCKLDYNAVKTLHEQSEVDGLDIVIPKAPKMVIPKTGPRLN